MTPYITALECKRAPGISFVMYGLWVWSDVGESYECVDTDADFYTLARRNSLENPIMVRIGPIASEDEEQHG